MTKPDPRALYAAERERQLKAQARRKPADPQQARPGRDPRAVVAVLMLPCATDVAPWQPCGHPELNHWLSDAGNLIWCSIVTPAGRCGCEKHTRPHDFGPDGRELTCRTCSLYLLDIAGPCEPPR